MSEHIKQFIDKIASGENSEAKDSIENALSAKAFEALDEYKKQLAQGIFGGKQEEQQQTETEVEVQETE